MFYNLLAFSQDIQESYSSAQGRTNQYAPKDRFVKFSRNKP